MENVSKEKFEQYLCERGDELDNAAHEFLCILAGTEIEWDISLIRRVISAAEEHLEHYGIPYCDPYHDEADGAGLGEDIICLEECKNPNCPLKMSANDS